MFNIYIAICSVITGFCLGAVIVKWKDIAQIRSTLNDIIAILIKNNDAKNEQLKEIFNTQRRILLTMLQAPEDERGGDA